MTISVNEREAAVQAAKPVDEIKLMVGGQGGDGTLTVVNLLGRLFKELGLNTYDQRNVLSRIRGGHADGVIRASARDIFSVGDGIDVLLAFDEEAVETAKDLLSKECVIVYDSLHGPLRRELVPANSTVYSAKFSDLAGTELKNRLLKNTVSFAVLGRVLGVPDELAIKVVRARYERRGQEVLQPNLDALSLGFRVADDLGIRAHFGLPKGALGQRIQISGDDAIGMGFIAGGGRFYAGYPITPASEILEYLQANLPKFGGAAIQAEDEIAAINMALGASLAGVRAMVATSGPGQDLMTEGVGQAGMAELPLVIVEVQRSGPSTGMPTKHEQSDLNHVVFAGHGEFPRLVLAPANASDCFYMTVDALNLADKYQLPVFLLIDQAMGQNTQSVPEFDFSKVKVERGKLVDADSIRSIQVYKRYQITDDGVSPRTVPGVPDGLFQVTGNEHNEWGFVSVNPLNREAIVKKRMLKIDEAKKDMPKGTVFGDPSAELGFITYGSNYGPILEAMEILAKRGVNTKFLLIRSIFPLLEDEILPFLEGVKTAYVVECNLTGQLRGLIAKDMGHADKLVGINKYTGSPFRPSEIVNRVEGLQERSQFLGGVDHS